MSLEKPTRKMLDYARALARKLNEGVPWTGWMQNRDYEITTGDFSGEHAPVGNGRSCPPTYDEVSAYIADALKRLKMASMDDTKDMKTCPHCKGRDGLELCYSLSGWICSCSCGAHMDAFRPSPEEAIAAWNKAVDEYPVDDAGAPTADNHFADVSKMGGNNGIEVKR